MKIAIPFYKCNRASVTGCQSGASIHGKPGNHLILSFNNWLTRFGYWSENKVGISLQITNTLVQMCHLHHIELKLKFKNNA